MKHNYYWEKSLENLETTPHKKSIEILKQHENNNYQETTKELRKLQNQNKYKLTQ